MKRPTTTARERVFRARRERYWSRWLACYVSVLFLAVLLTLMLGRDQFLAAERLLALAGIASALFASGLGATGVCAARRAR